MFRIFILETISLWVVFIVVLHTWNIDLLISRTILVHHPTWRDLSPFSLFPSDSQFLGSSDPSEIDIYCIISSSILSSTSVRPKARVVKTQEPGKLLSTYRGPRSSWLVHELSTPSDFTIWIRTSSAPCSLLRWAQASQCDYYAWWWLYPTLLGVELGLRRMTRRNVPGFKMILGPS